MRNLYAESPELVRHLSRIAADVWGCAPYEDDDGTRWPLAMPLMGVITAFHPEDGTHAVQLAEPMDSLSAGATPDARLLHGMRDMTKPMPWRHACERAHALVRASCPLPSTRPPEDEEIAFSHLLETQWAMADGDGIRITVMRFMDEDAEPVTDPPFWNVVVWLDDKPVMNREVGYWQVSHARTLAARLFDVFEGSGASLRALADAHGWSTIMKRFRADDRG